MSPAAHSEILQPIHIAPCGPRPFLDSPSSSLQLSPRIKKSLSSLFFGVPWQMSILPTPRTMFHLKAAAFLLTTIASLWKQPLMEGIKGRFSSRIHRAKSGESEGYSSGESILVDQQLLERELKIAIEEENYTKAAKIRDDLRSLQEDSKAWVMSANAEFYNSFKIGDLGTMQALWSKGDNICCVPPGALGKSGYQAVIDSWICVWANYEFPLEIEQREVRVRVRGDVGYVTCVELVKTKGSSWGGQFVTNVFERIDGKWFI